MFDFAHIARYRESNRIEAKRATGGFPGSIWETYSAFANTVGGIILLGVEEQADKSFRVAPLPDPQLLVDRFWEGVNDPAVVSVNLLTTRDVRIEETPTGPIVVIEVPRATRYDRPVYIGGDRYTGSYRRCGEGDYRCSRRQIDAMLRDRSRKTADGGVPGGSSLRNLRPQTIRAYRNRLMRLRPRFAVGATDEEFLQRIGAVRACRDGALRPTVAALLLFGGRRAIARQIAPLRLEYIEEGQLLFSTQSGDCMNLYDFYTRVRRRFFHLAVSGGQRHAKRFLAALREGLLNALIHADYYSGGVTRITVERDRILMENPGSLRLGADEAIREHRRDQRNPRLAALFCLIRECGGTGDGLSLLVRELPACGWAAPVLTEIFNPAEGVRLTLSRGGSADDAPVITAPLSDTQTEQYILDFLTDEPASDTERIRRQLGLNPDEFRAALLRLRRAGLIECDDTGGNICCSLPYLPVKGGKKKS